jgi:plasmid stabilization system protein ParE
VKPFAIHAAAEDELRSAIAWHEEQRDGLGAEFRREFEATIARIRDNPMLYAAEGVDGVHLGLLHRFPYAVVYIDEADRIWVIAVAHQRRRPRYWARRLTK